MKNNIDKLISKEPSKWMEQVEYYEENKEWLDKSALIALKILRTLRAQKMSQKTLAVTIGVTPQQINKVVKGNENLTLATICKIENALNIELIQVPSYISTVDVMEDFWKEKSKISSKTAETLSKEKTDYNPEKEVIIEVFDEAA
jgi:transcriptional regulator with XRE-family HTH domain